MAQLFQFGAQRKVVVNLPVENDAAVPIVGVEGLVALLEVDDFQARRAQGEKIRLEHALLIGSAMNQRSGGLADSFRRRTPVFSGEPGNPAQRSAPLRFARRLARHDLQFQEFRPPGSLSGVPAWPQWKTPRAEQFLRLLLDPTLRRNSGNQWPPPAKECTRALTPFHMICTPMQTRRNDESRRVMIMPLSPMTAAMRSAKA